MDIEKLEKLNELKEKGILSEAEFQAQKEKLLQDKPPVSSLDIQNLGNRNYSMLMHLSQFCCFIVPILGWVVPLIMWITKQDDAYIDQQGKVIFNWVISSFIYSMICVVLMFLIIGFFMMAALVICSIIFTILGAINAKDGIIRNYPMTIRFFAVNDTVQAA